MTTTIKFEKPIKRGSKWEQRTQDREGNEFVRIIKIIAAPTLSSPVGYRVLRNDAHPHRKGKTATIRRADLRAKYEAVAA